jgi:predicted nucleotidyltransferase
MKHTVDILINLQKFFLTEPSIVHAWLFGSFARNQSHEGSDVDVMIEMKTDKPYTLFDLFEIQNRLEKALNRKVDLVEKDFVKPIVYSSTKNDLIAIV